MMKLYRPLCSDVTLRLAVDVSPGFDDDESDNDPHCRFKQTSEKHASNTLEENSQKTTNGRGKRNNTNNNSHDSTGTDAPLDNNSNRYHQHSSNHQRGHHHSCSWYSRQNTSDKTAKDIYNHEHVLNGDGSTDDFKKVPLDSEFKRCVEEEGNDYKEVSLYQELKSNCDWQGQDEGLHGRDSPHQYQYSDAELSGCCSDHVSSGAKRSRSDEQLDVDKSYAEVSNKRKRHASRQSDFSSEGDKESCDDVDDEDGEVEEEEIVDGVNSDELSLEDVDIPNTHTGLPIDFDEDIGVIDKQIMSQSMNISFYGEIDDTEVQLSMTQSFHANVEEIPDEMTKSIAEEIHDVLLGNDETVKTDDVFANMEGHAKQLPFSYPFTLKHVGHLFDKSRHHFTSTEKKSRERASSSTSRSTIDDTVSESSNITKVDVAADSCEIKTEEKDIFTEDRPPRMRSISTMTAVASLELEVTHRGLHRFIPRHKDEMNIGIGDPIHVIKECDDLWCEGINLRTGERGIFPAMYANDLNFLEESDDEEEYWKFSMRFLGSVEVTSHKGDETLVHAINKIAMANKGTINSASLSTLEINQYGIRMIDKSKEGHEKDAFSHFFALKNISFCGTHPKNNRYFAFITKHPRDYRFACHVFHGDRPTHRARDALGEAFKRFYQEYMAFTHPTEDIYME